MALSRQKTPAVRLKAADRNLSAHGAYELAAADGEAQVTLFASGTEVAIAMVAREQLHKEGHREPGWSPPLAGSCLTPCR